MKVVLPVFCLSSTMAVAASVSCPRLDFSTPSVRPLLDTTRIIVESFASAENARSTEIDGDFLSLSPHADWAPDFAMWLESRCSRRITLSDLKDLRAQWPVSFNATRSFRGDEGLITDDLATFTATTNFHAWPREIIAFSPIKLQTRAIYRSPASFGRRLSVSETLETKDGNPAAPVRETEIAIERRDGSGNWDFYAYRQDGRLANESRFPVGFRPSPTACLSCHFSVLTGLSRRSPNESDD